MADQVGDLSEPSEVVTVFPELPESPVAQTFETEIFIEGFKAFPCLWNTSIASYKDRNCKINAWEKLSQMFDKNGKYLH